MNNIQKYIVLLLMVMLFVPNTAWAQTNKQEFVIKGVVEDNLGPVAGAVREEKVELVSGDGLKAYSVVCGSFGVKANAEGLKQYLDGQGYNAKVVYNAERNMYRVIASSYDDRAQATQAKEEFKAKYPNRDDFQKAWLLYRVY